jgi:hypothetical protein
VFIDGTPQLQVATTDTPAAGQLARCRRHVVLGSSPAGRTVSDRPRAWLTVAADDVTIDGLTRYTRPTDLVRWPSRTGDRLTVRNSVMSDTHGAVVNRTIGSALLNTTSAAASWRPHRWSFTSA